MKTLRSLASLLFIVLLATMFFQAIAAPSLEAFAIIGVVSMIGFAALTPWSDYRPGRFAANIIADDLQLTRVLDNAIIGLKAALLPLNVFSTAYRNVPVGNDSTDGNSVTVPVYAFTSGDVQTRTPGQSYKAKVSATSTEARKIVVNTEKVVGISFTNEEAQNQVAFDPVRHGMIKGRDLAITVLKDIFSIARYGKFPNRTLTPMASSAFDVQDVADLAQICMEDDWPMDDVPGLVLNPAFHMNLVRQPNIIEAQASGSTDALRQARINQILGFNETGTNAVPLNNSTIGTFTAATTDICTKAAHGLLTGDQVTVSSATTLPAGLSANTYYYVIKIDADTFKLSTTLAGAVAGTGIVDITDTGTGAHTIYLKNNIVGFAGHPSAIITGFRPVIPTAGIRQKLINFELVDDPESGLTLEYRHIADEDTGEEFQLIGCRYGYQYGLAAALKLISKAAA